MKRNNGYIVVGVTFLERLGEGCLRAIDTECFCQSQENENTETIDEKTAPGHQRIGIL